MSYKPFNFVQPPVDVLSDVQAAIEFEHAKVHSGQRFILTGVQVVSTAIYKWGITTPAAPVQLHTDFIMDAGSEARIAIIEAPATYSGGTAWPAYNMNRPSATVPPFTALRGVTASGGTTIFEHRSGDTAGGGAAHAGSEVGGRYEFILLPATVYVFETETYSASIPVSLDLTLYIGGPLA